MSARLSPQEERALVSAAADRNGAARDHLVDSFLPLIASMARGYGGVPGIERKELMQEGVVGLLRALQRYDAELGTPFWPYARWWVRQAMQKLVAELRRPFVLSDRALRELARVKDAQRAHLQSDRREPTVAELAQMTGMPVEHVRSLIAAERPPRALEDSMGGGDDAGKVGDFVADPRAEDAFERVITQVATESVRDLPGDLCERERMIVSARYGIGRAPQTLRQLAHELGISAERVRQIEEGALAKLHHVIAEPGLASV